ncbi:zinc-dependent alcohol dehydrogenase family protein [Geothrix terrae]|uniref:zinc-dependent alcohol dehydrogenase family protein n=1 Tax=Geothrix terrae TaxID=2922720 RepID=UPI001FAC0BF5|nr:NAD(P)-dependent alcohol dehydrogenase [Geothrix terrae]
MKTYQITSGRGITSLELVERELAAPGPNQVRVRIRAVALNYRDLMIADGTYLSASPAPVVPASDAAGEVVAVGPGVTRFRVGDRVASTFFPRWIHGRPTPANTAGALGAVADGVLAEAALFHEEALVEVPAHLDFREAASIPCAGVTAWNSLFVEGRLKAGDSVLLLGTGGVSIWALQIASAAGLRTILTSSSDAKLERARALGAHETLNYREIPEWQDEVRRLTGGEGVDLALEVGGLGTFERSMASTRMGGTVAIIGGLSGWAGAFDPFAVIGGAKRLAGIFVGNRAMSEDLGRFLSATGVRPVIDRAFPFAQTREAYEHLRSGRHFGKVVIDL